MRFVIDTNLPPALAAWLVEHGHEASHTTRLGLETSLDVEIWRYAASIDAIIVTKDEDFAFLKAMNADGPQVVWIRIGNAVRRVLMRRFIAIWPMVMKKIEQGHGVVEVR